MKIAIFGAGAIGGFLGVTLSHRGQDVSLVVRGAHLAAIRERGLRVRSAMLGDFSAHPFATDDPSEIGPVDIVVITVKAHSVTQAAPMIAPLLGFDTPVVNVQNGIPWWYFHGLDGKWKDARLESVDPGGVIREHIDPARVIGGIAYCSSRVIEPGVISHLNNIRFLLGEPDGTVSERARRLSDAIVSAGLESPISTSIREQIWVKVLGNAPFNPISALTGATMEQMMLCAQSRRLCDAVMGEVRAVAAAFGSDIPITNQQRLDFAESVGAHKTSMLQDFEAGRPLELEPIVGAVIEMAEKAGLIVPHLRAIYACAKLLARS